MIPGLMKTQLVLKAQLVLKTLWGRLKHKQSP